MRANACRIIDIQIVVLHKLIKDFAAVVLNLQQVRIDVSRVAFRLDAIRHGICVGLDVFYAALKLRVALEELFDRGLRGRGGGIDRDYAFFLNREIVEFLHGHVVVVRRVRVFG